jgi:hypothetical protein
MNTTKPVLAKSLNSPEIINQFAQDFVDLQNKWSKLNSTQRISAIVEMVNKAQKSAGIPTGEIKLNSAQENAGEFSYKNWLIKVSSKSLNNSNVLSPEVAEELALTLYHEIRHSEQFFRIAQKEALKFNDNGKLKNSAQITLETEIDERITKQAISSVQNFTPEQKKQLLKELAITAPWYRSLYPKTPAEANAEATENKFRASYINKLSSTRQRNTQNAKPSTSRNKSEEDWTDKFYNRSSNQQLSVESEVYDKQSAVLKSDKSSKNTQSVANKLDNSNSPSLYQKLSQITEKMPHNLVKLGLDPQNPRHREIFMTMYAINTGIDPHQLLENSPYNSPKNVGKNNTHTESIISQAAAKIDEAAKASTASTTRNIDRGL